ncbi:hypothetical protein ACF3NT_05780 [Naumannella halotolerans]|uniref:DUF1648 domain-containing protein n=1 Tax=Naumannella halotolerans TaxID=993414 RepID=A0A4R7J7W0_9ACTN|nr:hypothetical protein [Naumannella halotolerans]TDT33551.1 hypothetical protein CLV29_1173 [Naumannella halotolerans]
MSAVEESPLRRALTALSWLVAVGIWLWLAFTLPSQVVVHLGSAGARLGSKWWLLCGIAAVLALFALIPWLVGVLLRRTADPALLNLPDAEFWLAPTHRQETLRRIRGGLAGILGVTAVFLLAVVAAVVRTDPGNPAPVTTGITLASVVVVALLVAWALWWRRTFRRRSTG